MDLKGAKILEFLLGPPFLMGMGIGGENVLGAVFVFFLIFFSFKKGRGGQKPEPIAVLFSARSKF